MPDEELNIDFGDEELNNPNYEADIDKQEGGDAAPAEGTVPADDGQQQTEQGAGVAQQEAGQDDTGQSKAGKGGAEQQAPQRSAGANAKADKDGNLIDKDGNIVAKAGLERRQYERVQQQASYIDRLEKELVNAKNSDAMAKALNEVPSKLGLDMRETELGMQAIASFKKDPIGTAKWLLQETMKQGYTLQQIIGEDAKGQLNGGSLDLAAVKDMIAEQMRPLIGDRQAQQASTQAREAAQREYDGFIAKHENADIHGDVLGNMMQGNPSLTPEVAYWQLREYAAKHGLDFTQPLREQIAARQQGEQRQQSRNGNATPQTQIAAMPNGGNASQPYTNGPVMNDADDAWDTIVKQSLAEAGMN